LDQSPQGQLNAFPIGLTQTPRLPPSHVSQRGPNSHQEQNPRLGPHRKTLNKADIVGRYGERQLWAVRFTPNTSTERRLASLASWSGRVSCRAPCGRRFLADIPLPFRLGHHSEQRGSACSL
jgi:hypothetical protein